MLKKKYLLQLFKKIASWMNYFANIYSFWVFDREESEGKLKGILGYTEDDVVSTDFVGDSR